MPPFPSVSAVPLTVSFTPFKVRAAFSVIVKAPVVGPAATVAVMAGTAAAFSSLRMVIFLLMVNLALSKAAYFTR